MTVKIIHGDALQKLKEMPDESVDCCVTSPPYWGLRDYGTAEWSGGDPDCDHFIFESYKDGKRRTDRPLRHRSKAFCEKCGAKRIDRQIGIEDTLADHIAAIVVVFREVRRVLKKSGTLWLNYGDVYATTPNGKKASDYAADGSDDRRFRDKPFSTVGGGLKPKDLVGLPWRIAFALQADGWWLRRDIIWEKPNPVPESVKDRPTTAHEYVFLMTKSPRYYYDYKAIMEEAAYDGRKAITAKGSIKYANGVSNQKPQPIMQAGHKRWTETNGRFMRNKRSVWKIAPKPFKEAHFATFPPKLVEPCILAGCPENGTVIDPFGGSGTVGLVAEQHKRNAVLIELNSDYVNLAKLRIERELGLLADIV